jgi:hypothetical protein
MPVPAVDIRVRRSMSRQKAFRVLPSQAGTGRAMSSPGTPSEGPATNPAEEPRDDPQTQIAPEPEEPLEDEEE